MKRIILILIVMVNIVLADYAIDGYKLPYQNNPTLGFKKDLVNVGFSYSKKVYNSDNPMIAYLKNGKIISYNRCKVGYDYIRKEAVLKAAIRVSTKLGYNEFVLIINGAVVDRFSIGTESNFVPQLREQSITININNYN